MLAHNAASPPGTSTRSKRCRTGCLKCRMRRKKCDEGKPRCRNCIFKDFECRYATPLIFLAKNAYTALPLPLDSTADPVPQYANLDLVKKHTRERRQSALSQSSLSSTRLVDPTGDVDVALGTSGPPASHATGNPNLYDQASVDLTVDGRYESALHNLISDDGPLSTASTSTAAPGRPELGYSPVSMLDLDDGQPQTIAHEISENSQALPILRSIVDISGSSLQMPIPLERDLDLVRYFRYHIAPWLDICDLQQSFGVVLPRLAARNPGVRYAILALSSRYMNTPDMQTEKPEDVESKQLLLLSEAQHSQHDNHIAGSVSAVLRNLWLFLTKSPRSWTQDIFHDFSTSGVARWPSSSDVARLCSSVDFLMLRMELSVALVTSQPTRASSLEIVAWQAAYGFERMAEENYALQALLLCIETVNLCWRSASSYAQAVNSSRSSIVDAWRNLLERLLCWYQQRPKEFLPVLELPTSHSNGVAFPVNFFSNGANIFANQLHHTAMLVLLTHKPRMVRLSEVTPYTSPLWQGEQLCGIALNNDRRACWDPCLLASLWIAARRMTHGSQQRALARGIARIGALTGFDVVDILDDLRNCWALEDG